MQEQLQKRLQSLKTEYEAGQQVLANLEAKKSGLRETLIRISGAIQVLEEELAIVTESENEQPTEPLAKEE
ncbi:MAG: hypothetical protein ACK5RE_04540 [Pseudanabaena sp.]|jgi:predicted nuclease with TOPRIM domain